MSSSINWHAELVGKRIVDGPALGENVQTHFAFTSSPAIHSYKMTDVLEGRTSPW
jgi:hypothetical protein